MKRQTIVNNNYGACAIQYALLLCLLAIGLLSSVSGLQSNIRISLTTAARVDALGGGTWASIDTARTN